VTIPSPWKVAHGTHPLSIVDFQVSSSSKRRVICASSSEVGALPSSMHRHGVYVMTKPRTTHGSMPSRSSFRGLAERIHKTGSCAGTRTKQGTFRLRWRRTRDSDYRRRESRNPTDLYFCVSLGSRSICPGGPTEVDEQVGCGIGIISHARIHNSKEVCLVWFGLVTDTF
jgi:hypothetical protein